MNTVKGSEIAAREDLQQALKLGVKIADNGTMVEELRSNLKGMGGDVEGVEEAAEAVDIDSSAPHERKVVRTEAAAVRYDTDGTESYASSGGGDFDDENGGN
jgi:hypothetical protein